jgi:hypothetical protein
MNQPSQAHDCFEESSDSPYYLKCHACHRRLVLLYNQGGSRTYECPEAHVTVIWQGISIIGYTLFWDADLEASERYKMVSSNGITTLFQSRHSRKYYRALYEPILDMDRMLTLEIKDQTVVVNNLIPRLKKLKAFT